jgi:hypothetical protein
MDKSTCQKNVITPWRRSTDPSVPKKLLGTLGHGCRLSAPLNTKKRFAFFVFLPATKSHSLSDSANLSKWRADRQISVQESWAIAIQRQTNARSSPFAPILEAEDAESPLHDLMAQGGTHIHVAQLLTTRSATRSRNDTCSTQELAGEKLVLATDSASRVRGSLRVWNFQSDSGRHSRFRCCQGSFCPGAVERSRGAAPWDSHQRRLARARFDQCFGHFGECRSSRSALWAEGQSHSVRESSKSHGEMEL